MVQVKDIAQADTLVRANWSYEATTWELFHWRSHAADVIAGKHWQAPCADLTSTILDLLTGGNPWFPFPAMKLADCYRLLVSTTNEHRPDHAVGCVVTSDGGMWIVGDTFRRAYPSHEMAHRPVFYNRLSEAGSSPTWRNGAPWDVDLSPE